MGRKVAMLWHASFAIGAGVLFFYFVLPRWPELMGDTPHAVGTTLRIVTGVLIGLTALPVVFTLLRTRKPELGIPALALSIRTWSIVAHVLAGVLIVGTAICEIWLSLDSVGQWLFGIYGAAAAIALLGIFAFYLSFVAELPPPPKPLKAKEPKRRRVRRKKGGKGAEADTEAATTVEEAADEEAVDSEAVAAEAGAEESDRAEVPVEAAVDTPEGPEPDSVVEETPKPADTETPKPEDTTEKAATEPEAVPAEPRLRNRRPSGKTSHRRRRTRGGVAVEE